MKTVTVSATALKQVLSAIDGPMHHIREMQVTRNLPGSVNPINTLVEEYNAAVEAHNAELLVQVGETVPSRTKRKYSLVLDVTAPGDMLAVDVVRLVDAILNCGYADAQQTIENGEGNLDDAKKVFELTMTTPRAVACV